MARRSRWVILSLGALVLSSCSIDDPTPLQLALNLELDQTLLAVNDSVEVTVIATNYGSKPIALTAPAGCLLFYDVRNANGTLVFRSSESCSGPAVTETIQGGVERRAVLHWDGRGSNGLRVPSGNYAIQAGAAVAEGSRVGAAAVVRVE
jgi:hypothetical protein